ncbi:hypothetical protein BGZ70_009633 [Mortierella alpina]|uniref:Uncharacterized protein n=1 Tax=Mortierella alpina TaxID=64518 RepID=A0A9P6M6Q3_MORAP|nr:hypothetical protein BGZ70_009633 [Mortierella alpina]
MTASRGSHAASSSASGTNTFEDELEERENKEESEQMRQQREAAVTMTMFSRSATAEVKTKDSNASHDCCSNDAPTLEREYDHYKDDSERLVKTMPPLRHRLAVQSG